MTEKRGLTLIEVLIASFVAAAGTGAVLLAMAAMTHTARSTATVQAAIHEMRAEMERLHTYPFASTNLQLGLHNWSDGIYVVEAGTRPGTRLITVYRDVRWPNNATSRLELTTGMAQVLH